MISVAEISPMMVSPRGVVGNAEDVRDGVLTAAVAILCG